MPTPEVHIKMSDKEKVPKTQTRGGISLFFSGIVVGALIVLYFKDFSPPTPTLGGVTRTPKCASSKCADPATLGELTHEQSGVAWPSEFRTWIVDKPQLLSDLFKERAMIQGTDKTTTHRYQYMYAKYLLPVRHRDISLLEIGLGCDTQWGPGHSVDLWHELLPRMTYYSIELDAGCAMKFIPRLGERQFIGSQKDASFLETVMNKTGLLDVIIDDGSHYTDHQRFSFAVLWKSVKPGGIYIIEDLQCTFLSGYNGEPSGFRQGTSARMIVDILLALMGKGRDADADQLAYQSDFVNQIASVDCFREACVFVKAGYPEPLSGKSTNFF